MEVKKYPFDVQKLTIEISANAPIWTTSTIAYELPKLMGSVARNYTGDGVVESGVFGGILTSYMKVARKMDLYVFVKLAILALLMLFQNCWAMRQLQRPYTAASQ